MTDQLTNAGIAVFWESDHCKRASDAAVERAEKTLRYNRGARPQQITQKAI